MGGETLERIVTGLSRDKVAGFELIVLTAVRGNHIYKDSWAPTVGEEFVCYQKRAIEHDRHTIAVYGDGDANDILGYLSRKFLQVLSGELLE